MPDIIQLLPDSVANQIAAGEVIQRPASAVKELLENAIDAGSQKIQVIIKDAGKTLIQVIDDGCGMSETDARMSFERHATSKIRTAAELFSIKTKGFRGEALASIAAIAHVELKSRLRERETGTRIIMEGSEIISQEPCSTPCGTSFAIKNLFYNVPARRNFLKSESVEMRHIIEEFERVSLAHPDVAFSLHHNKNELFNLPTATLRQRIVNMFGSKYNQKLVPLEEKTHIVSVNGFIGKPEYARKSRGEQYFFVNNRFIKSAYLNHSVSSAFDHLLARGNHPSYYIFLDVDPETIDINIHPTKTEIKFRDEKAIYAIVNSAVKKSLGQYNITPSIDFEQENSMNIAPLPKGGTIKAPGIKVNYDYNPFEQEKKPSGRSESMRGNKGQSSQHWEDLYKISRQSDEEKSEKQEIFRKDENELESKDINRVVFQLHRRYIMTHIKSGIIFIDQQRAHERILYEKAMQSLDKNRGHSQQQLFPQTVELSTPDYELLKDLKEDLYQLGFDLENFGHNCIVINGIPAEAVNGNIKKIIEDFIEQYKFSVNNLKLSHSENMARSIARSICIKTGKVLQAEEMMDLADRLFACEMPYYAPNGKPTIVTFSLEELNEKFENK